MVCGMKIIEGPKIGLGSGATGYVTTPQWIMAIIFVEYAVIGLNIVKSHWTISNQELSRICLRLVIFNRHMDIVTILKARKGGNQ